MSKETDWERNYQDSDGDPCTLRQLVSREPEWAVSRITELEKLEAALKQIVFIGNRENKYE